MMELKLELGDGDDKVVSLTMFRANREERERISGSKVIGFGGVSERPNYCRHQRVTMDTTLAELVCDQCNQRLNPIEWLANLVEHWHHIQRAIQRWNDSYDRAKAAEASLELRSRTKCQHCKQMTRIRGL
jgi:hypothetical protein